MSAQHLVLALLGTALISAPALAQANPPAPTPQVAPTPAAPAPTMPTGNWLTQEQPGQWRASKLKGLNVYNQGNDKIGDISELLVDESGKVQAVVVGVGGFLGMGQHDVAIPFDQMKLVNEPRATVATAADNQTVGTASPTAPTPGLTSANPNMATNNARVNAPATTGSIATPPPADTANRAAPDRAVLTMDMTKDQLKAAPEFKFAR